MKRNQSSATPSTVLKAFAPETEITVSLDAWLLMEAMELGFATGTRPTTRDVILGMLIVQDADAVQKARRGGKVDELIARATKGKSVGDIMACTAPLMDAINAAFEPTDSGAEQDGIKKPDAAPAGG